MTPNATAVPSAPPPMKTRAFCTNLLSCGAMPVFGVAGVVGAGSEPPVDGSVVVGLGAGGVVAPPPTSMTPEHKQNKKEKYYENNQ